MGGTPVTRRGYGRRPIRLDHWMFGWTKQMRGQCSSAGAVQRRAERRWLRIPSAGPYKSTVCHAATAKTTPATISAAISTPRL
jgi:hypothetical protein